MASPAVGPPKTLPPDFDKWDSTSAKAPATLPADFSEWDKPSAGQRYMQSTGLTTGGRSLPQQIGYEASQTYHHPIDTAKETVTAPVKGYAAAAEEQFGRMKDHWSKGDHAGAVVHGLYYLLTPVGGANMGRAADQAASGDLAGAAGSMTMPTAGIVAGSPSVRSAAGAGINAVRNAAATTLEAGAKPVASLSAGATALHELISGRPGTAAVVISHGKPMITRGMNAAASLIRPGQAPIDMLPLTRQMLNNPALKEFLNSPEFESQVSKIEGQKPASSSATNVQADAQIAAAQQNATHAAPASVWPPERPSAIQQPPQSILRKAFGDRADILEDKGFQEANRSDLESHGRQVYSQQKKEWFARNQPGSTKGDLAAQFQPEKVTLDKYVNLAKNTLGKDASDGQIMQAAQKLKAQDDDIAGLLQKSIEQVQAKKAAAQGGHAGGGVSSVEELSRPGVNYVLTKGGQLTYHGKSFAPESTPAGATHVTVLPNGQFRVNAGTSLTDGQIAALKRAINEK